MAENKITPFDAKRFAITAANVGIPWHLMSEDGPNKVEAVSNIPLDSPVGQQLYLRSQIEADTELGSLAGQEIELAGFVARGVNSVDAAGEITSYVRFALFTPDLKTCYASSSEGVKSAIDFLISMRGMGLWDPPIRCRVIEKKTSNNRRFHQLLPILSGDVPESK